MPHVEHVEETRRVVVSVLVLPSDVVISVYVEGEGAVSGACADCLLLLLLLLPLVMVLEVLFMEPTSSSTWQKVELSSRVRSIDDLK